MGETALLGPWVSSNHSLRPGKLGLSDQGERCARPAHAVPCNCPLEKPTPAATGPSGGRISMLSHPALPLDYNWPGGLEAVPSHRAHSRGQLLVPVHRARCRR